MAAGPMVAACDVKVYNWCAVYLAGATTALVDGVHVDVHRMLSRYSVDDPSFLVCEPAWDRIAHMRPMKKMPQLFHYCIDKHLCLVLLCLYRAVGHVDPFLVVDVLERIPLFSLLPGFSRLTPAGKGVTRGHFAHC